MKNLVLPFEQLIQPAIDMAREFVVTLCKQKHGPN